MPELSETIDQALAAETQFNWPAMFTAFASGSSLDDISATFACPLPVLRRAASVQDWAAMASRIVAPPAVQAKPETEARLAVLEANRSKNYQMADLLRDRLIHDFTALRQGTLRVEKVTSSRGQVIHTEVEPGPQDMLAMANAAKSVADMTYRALGDVQAEDRNASRGSGDATSITVILPTVVHTAPVESIPVEVVDLRKQGIEVDTVIKEKAAARRATKELHDGPGVMDDRA